MVLFVITGCRALAAEPIVAPATMTAVGEVDGPAAELGLLDELALDEYHLFHAARGDALDRLGRRDDARHAYDRALALVTNDAERALLERRRAGIPEGDTRDG